MSSLTRTIGPVPITLAGKIGKLYPNFPIEFELPGTNMPILLKSNSIRTLFVTAHVFNTIHFNLCASVSLWFFVYWSSTCIKRAWNLLHRIMHNEGITFCSLWHVRHLGQHTKRYKLEVTWIIISRRIIGKNRELIYWCKNAQ